MVAQSEGVVFPAAEIDELRRRLRAARFPRPLGPGGGIAPDRLRGLADRWADGFDFAACAERLNRHPHRRDGRLHFVHVPGPAQAPALLLLHGWPGSFVEMLELVDLLRGQFSLVVPSLPGFGYSEAAPGETPEQIASALGALMERLGHPRFFVQGGDVGAGVGTWLARRHPERVLGLHLNYVPGSFAPFVEGELSAEELRFLETAAQWADRAGAYSHLQRTRPLTLGYALEDSPAGLLAWIAEKFDEWSDPASKIPDDTLLANASIYWFTRTAYSSVRYYLESARAPHRFARGERVAVPCALARFPCELPLPPHSYVARAYDLRRDTSFSRGGHFAALEVPALLADDVRAFVRDLQATD